MSRNKQSCLGTLFLITVMILSLGFVHQFITVTRADCSAGDSGEDNVNCANDPDDSIIETGDGNDDVTIDNSDIDYVDTGNDNDTVTASNDSQINYGINAGNGDDTVQMTDSTVTGDVNGDTGDDSIGLQHSSTFGINGGDGNDTITGNDVVAFGNVDGGTNDDQITLTGDNGRVLFDVRGGDGNDTITVGSEVDGLAGDNTAVDGGEGNDVVKLVDGATFYNAISGGNGIDVLQFKFTVGSNEEKDAFQKLLDKQDAASGFVEFNGQTYYWNSFEALQNLLRVIGGGGGGASVVITVLGDSRLNQDAVAGPIAVYCNAGSIEVWTINPADGHGDLSLKTVESALPQSANGISVALNGDQVTTTFGDYSYSFPAVICPG